MKQCRSCGGRGSSGVGRSDCTVARASKHGCFHCGCNLPVRRSVGYPLAAMNEPRRVGLRAGARAAGVMGVWPSGQRRALAPDGL